MLQYLRDTGVKFTACDNPHANKLTIHILVGVAENEAEMISHAPGTRWGLQGGPEGQQADPGPLPRRRPSRGRRGDRRQARGLAAPVPQPDRPGPGHRPGPLDRGPRAGRCSAEVIGRLVTDWRQAEPDLTLQAIADRLNARRRKTPRGKSWTPTQVRRVLNRIRPA